MGVGQLYPLPLEAAKNYWEDPHRRFPRHLAVKALLDMGRWEVKVIHVVTCTPMLSACWENYPIHLAMTIFKEFQDVWDISDCRLGTSLSQFFNNKDCITAWNVWSFAAEDALCDAYRFAGRRMPHHGMICKGRGKLKTRIV